MCGPHLLIRGCEHGWVLREPGLEGSTRAGLHSALPQAVRKAIGTSTADRCQETCQQRCLYLRLNDCADWPCRLAMHVSSLMKWLQPVQGVCQPQPQQPAPDMPSQVQPPNLMLCTEERSRPSLDNAAASACMELLHSARLHRLHSASLRRLS